MRNNTIARCLGCSTKVERLSPLLSVLDSSQESRGTTCWYNAWTSLSTGQDAGALGRVSGSSGLSTVDVVPVLLSLTEW